jgi:hypothetical protein
MHRLNLHRISKKQLYPSARVALKSLGAHQDFESLLAEFSDNSPVRIYLRTLEETDRMRAATHLNEQRDRRVVVKIELHLVS